MRVRVKLFAAARELAGTGEVVLEVADGATVDNLQRALLTDVPALENIVSHARWAVDAEFAAGDSVVTEQAEVALIPPVSGG
jgi:molybdopterin converting factor subunit 1